MARKRVAGQDLAQHVVSVLRGLALPGNQPVGRAVGQMHAIHRPDRPPIEHRITDGGRVIARRTTGLTTHGDYLYVAGMRLDPAF